MRARTDLAARRGSAGPGRGARGARRLGALALGLLALSAGAGSAQDPPAPLMIHYVERRVERPTPLNNEPPIPDDQGLRGAELGLRDGSASGRFLGLTFALKTVVVDSGADLRAALSGETPRFLIVNAPAEDVLALADAPELGEAVLLNIGAPDTRLRDGDCRARLLHVLPSRAMLADALAQLLAFKRWTRILLVSGPNPGDALYAEAIRRSARTFGARIVA